MVTSDDITELNENLDNLSNDFQTVFYYLRRLNHEDIDMTLIKKGEKYISNGNSRLEKMKTAYSSFSSQFHQICEQYINEVCAVEKEDHNEVEILKGDFKNMIKEMIEKQEGLNNVTLEQKKEFSFVYQKASKSKMDVELVKKYPGSHIYKEYMSDRRNKDGDVFIDCEVYEEW